MKEFNNEKFKTVVPRRKFLLSAGMVAAGAVLSACALTEEPLKIPASFAQAPEWPWPYHMKLDPEKAYKKGYDGYMKGGCCYGAIVATLGYAQEEFGEPFTNIPLDMFRYGAGGSVGWGTLCGALNGAGAFLNLVTKDFSPLVNELNGWYTQTPFPSNKHETYGKFPNQVTTIPATPLCHDSVSGWAAVSGAKVNEKEKKDRCGKLTGDVAAKAIELLNAQLDGKFAAAFKPSQDIAHCNSCHVGKDSLLDNVQGKMNCVTCHDDHTKK
jgi:hypothetical protein